MSQVSRRSFMHIVGGGTILAATLPLAGCDDGPSTADKPWEQAGHYDEPLRNALSYALLAPNPHNRQPWMVDLAPNGEALTLYVDTERMLPHTDPFNRQITVGLGCFLELMVLAAKAQGFTVALNLFPEGFDEAALDKRPVAQATFTKAPTTPAPLFDHVLTRRSNKEPFDDTKAVSTEALSAITQAAHPNVQTGQTNAQDKVTHLRDITWQAFEIEYITPATLGESIDLMRMGSKEVNANPDGIDMRGGFLEIMMALGILTKDAMRDPTSTAWQQGLDMYRPITGTAMGYVWIKTKGNDRLAQIKAGRSRVRMNLAATAQGLGLHPLSQVLQEYEEMAALYAQVHEELAIPGQTIQMLGRVGYGTPPAPAPRWPLDAKLI